MDPVGRDDRPVADRPDPAFQPDYLCQRVRRDPGTVCRPAPVAITRIHARHFFVQHGRRPLRTVRRRRPGDGRDGLPGRRIRPVRSMRRDPLQTRGARRQGAGALDSRRAAMDCRRGHRAIPPSGQAGHCSLAGAAGRARLSPAGPGRHDAVGRRGPTAQDCPGANSGRQAIGAQALSARRADHRPASR